MALFAPRPNSDDAIALCLRWGKLGTTLNMLMPARLLEYVEFGVYGFGQHTKLAGIGEIEHIKQPELIAVVG